MRTLTATVVLAAGMATPAQPPGPADFGYFGGMTFVNLLRKEAVQKELKMTPEQVERATAVTREFLPLIDQKMKAARDKLGPDTPAADRRKILNGIAADANREVLKALEKVLTPEQLRRAEQLQVQALGLSAFHSPAVIRELKLTPAQEKAADEVAAAYEKEVFRMLGEAIKKGGVTPEREADQEQHLAGSMRRAIEKVVAGLTDEQKKVWQGMVGEPFDMTQLAPAFPRKKE
jgi:hypothetical protein